MHVLQLVPERLPTSRPDISALFGKYLPREGIECDIVVGGWTGSFPDEQHFASVRRSSGAGGRIRREIAYVWLCLRALAGVDRRGGRVIQVRDTVPFGLLALAAARWKRIPFVYWMSFLMSEDRQDRARRDGASRSSVRSAVVSLRGRIEAALLYRLLLPASTHVFVQSAGMRDYLTVKGIDASKITPVPMGVDTERLRRDAVHPRRIEGWEGVPLIVYLGTLDRSRHPEVLIDMLEQVRRRHREARLLLVGSAHDAPSTQWVAARARAMGLREAVHITGWLPTEEAWQLICAADVAVSFIPRSLVFDVSSPTKLVEYLALGVPTIANDNPDQESLLRESGAGWLTASNAAALAEAACEILGDLDSARRRAARGPAAVESHRSYHRLVPQVAAHYRRLSDRA